MLIPVVPTFVQNFQPAFTVALNTSSTSDAGNTFTFVQKFLPAVIAKSGGSVRVVFTAATTGPGTVTGCYIGLSATSGNAWNFAATPTQIFWDNGQSSKILTANGVFTSDIASFAVTGSQAISIAFQFATGFRSNSRTGLGSNYIRYSKSGVTEAGTVSKGSSYTATSGRVEVVSQLLVA